MDFAEIATRIASRRTAGIKEQFRFSPELDQMWQNIEFMIQNIKNESEWSKASREFDSLVPTELYVDRYEGTSVESVVKMLDLAGGKPITRIMDTFGNANYVIGTESEIMNKLQQILDKYGPPTKEDVQALEYEDTESEFLKGR